MKFIEIIKIEPYLKNLPYKKPIIYSLIVIFGVGVVAYIFTHFYLKSKIEKLLQTDITYATHIEYTNLSLNLLRSSLTLDEVQFMPSDPLALQTDVFIKKIQIRGVSYFEAIRNGNFVVDHVLLDGVNVDYFRSDSIPRDEEPTNSKFKPSILIKNFEIQNSAFKSFEVENDSLQLQFENVDFKLFNCVVDAASIKNKIPFTFDSFKFHTGKVYVSLNEYEAIHIDTISSDDHTLITGFSLHSKYDKEKLQRRLHKERDYIDLKIPKIEFTQLEVGARNDKFYVTMKSGNLKNLDLEMYRNKLLPDDLTIKAMFTRTLKTIPIAINIPLLKVINGNISYSELVEAATNPGEILFTEVYSEIKNLSNTSDKEMVFTNKAKLMGVAPIELEWSFYTKEERNLFKATGVIKNFDTKSINPFLTSNLRAKAEGSIHELYFTISGDEYTSSGDIKMNYQDFGFVVLHKNRLGVNKVLTTIGNIFTNDGSKTDEKGYRYGEIKVERDPTKSFFNYLWINVKDGILDTFMGNGKKN